MAFLARERQGAASLAAILVIGILTNCSSGTNSGAISGGGNDAAAAGATDDTPQAGRERGPCYGNRTCNQGLTCASGLCVRIPDNGGGTGGDMSTAGMAAMSGSGVGAMTAVGGNGDAGMLGMGGDPNMPMGGDGSSNGGTSGMNGGGTAGMGGTAGNGGTGGSNAGNGGTGGTNGGVSGGGTGGTASCDSAASCGACEQCTLQESADCQTAMQKCLQTPQCMQLEMCMQTCDGNSACGDKCKAIYPQGLAPWTAVSQCMCGSCPSSCAGDTSWDCPGGVGGTGGTGGTGGSPSCDAMATCGNCAQCAQMASGDCAALATECKKNASCAIIEQCTQMCNGNEQCIQGCTAKAPPDGLMMWIPLSACVCQSCSNTCADNAGYGCPAAPGGGGTSGSGGTGGSASCDAAADCQSCKACSSQQDGACATAYAKCAMDPGCVQYGQCISSCKDQACIDKCTAGVPPSAVSEWQATLACSCKYCPSSCGTSLCP